jgi:uncharacterized membrane protein
MNPNISRLRHAKAAQARHANQSGNGHVGHSAINVGASERQASLIGGTVLAVCGLLRGSFSGLGLVAIGAALFYRGYSGHCQMYHLLDHSTADPHAGEHTQPGEHLEYSSHA